MIITFLTATDFGNMERAYKVRPKYFHAGFGTGRNVMYIMKIGDKVYAKLSPIANPVYANTSQVIHSERVINQMIRTLSC